MGVVLAVNAGAMEGRNMNNYCTPSITEAMFYDVLLGLTLLYFIYILLPLLF